MTVKGRIGIGKQDSRLSEIFVDAIGYVLKLRIQVCDELVKLRAQRFVNISPVPGPVEPVVARLPKVKGCVWHTALVRLLRSDVTILTIAAVGFVVKKRLNIQFG